MADRQFFWRLRPSGVSLAQDGCPDKIRGSRTRSAGQKENVTCRSMRRFAVFVLYTWPAAAFD
jgi:hypothetical protein